MIGTLINAGAIVAGGALGLALRGEASARHQQGLKLLLGMLSIYTGFRMVWMSVGGTIGRVLLQLGVALVALTIGHGLGRLLGLQRRVNRLGRYARERFEQARVSGRHDPAEGFVTCTILYCVGPLAILGALQDGLQGDPRTLLLKAGLDGVATLAFVKVFGWGAMLSALPVLAWQGTLTLLAQWLRPVLENPALADGLTATGGFMVASTALVILEVRKVPLADYLPALVVGPLLWTFVR